jgi:glycosyltransferase involved in cell wall biosynthesis
VDHYRSVFQLSLFCWSLPKKRGPAAARNFGWRNARGKLIVFVDDDCLADERLAETYWRAFEKEDEGCVAFTGEIRVPVSAKPTDYENNVSLLQTAEFVTANCACSKKCLEKINGFDEAFETAWREDSDLYFRFLKESIPVKHVDEARVTHPVRRVPWGISLKEQQKSQYDALLYKKHPVLFRSRIFKQANWRYYGIILAAIVTFIGISLQNNLALLSGIIWLLLTLSFFVKRLHNTSRSMRHIGEMAVTSMIIPFLSVYWTIYGSIRYRTWYL